MLCKIFNADSKIFIICNDSKTPFLNLKDLQSSLNIAMTPNNTTYFDYGLNKLKSIVYLPKNVGLNTITEYFSRS